MVDKKAKTQLKKKFSPQQGLSEPITFNEQPKEKGQKRIGGTTANGTQQEKI